MINLE